MCRKLVFLISFVVVLGLVSSGLAEEKTWVGGGDNSWCVDGHWSLSGVPGPEDTATISGAVVGPTIDCDVNVFHIDGPSGTDQAINVTSGHIVTHNTWAFGSDSGMGTINISGSPVIEIYGNPEGSYGRGWFGSDEGFSTINISGDPNIYVESGIRGADDTGTVYNFYMSGGYLNCNSYMIGDDGSGDFYLTGGKFVCRGEFKIHGREGGYSDILVGGEGSPAELIIGGAFLSPADSDGAAQINLDNGYIECAEWNAAGENWILDINEGLLRIVNPSDTNFAEIQSWIDAGQITGYNGTVTPIVTKDGDDYVVTVTFVHYLAYDESPVDYTTGMCPTGLELFWTPGEYCVDDHNVYFGTSLSDVNESANPVKKHHDSNSWTPPGPIELGTTYFWRVDEVNENDGNSPWVGGVWQFTTENGKAKDPSPEDGQRGAHPDSILRWTPPCVATGHKLYLGTDLPERIVLFEDGFEAGVDPNWTPIGWLLHDATLDPNYAHSGTYSAKAVGAGVKTLTSDDIDTRSDAGDYTNAFDVSIWVRTTEPMGVDELQLKYYNGSTYNAVNDFNVAQLDPNGRWVNFTDHVTNSQYFISNFRVQLVAEITSGTVYIDDVKVTNTWPVDPTWLKATPGPNDNNYAPALSVSQHYYWRVDTVAGSTVIQGDYWDFTTGLGGLIMYYKFDGSGGLPDPIHADESYDDVKFWKYDGGGSLTYGESNPMLIDSTASADFDPCVGLYCPDTGENDPLRLAGWQYTIEFWVKPENLDESLDIDEDDPEAEWLDENWDLVLIGKFGSWMIGIEDPGENNSFRWEHADNGESMFDDSAVVGEWVHIAAVYDRTNENDERMQFYHNGMLEESADETGLNPADNNYPVTIGYAQKDDVNVGRYFDGLIDEVRIYDIALTPCEFLLFPGPEWASCPNPYTGETEVDPCTVKLMWTPGEGAVSHDIYFNSDLYEVTNGTAVETGWGPNNWTPPTTPGDGTVYYWRIDTYDSSEKYEGVPWHFTTKYVIKDPALILWYKFDESKGDDAIDASGHGYHGDVDEEDNWDPTGGQFGGCLIFDDDQRVEPPVATTSTISNEITISVWLYGYTQKSVRDNWVLHTGRGDYFVEVKVPDENGDVYWRAGNDSNDALVWKDATPRAWIGDWHHFAFVKDENTKTMSIYFDALPVKSKTGTISSLTNIAGKAVRIGAELGHDSDYEGKMDDLRIYNLALSASEVGGLFRGGDIEFAWAPNPYDKQPDARFNTDLSWKPGDYAAEHKVFFGTSWQDVNSMTDPCATKDLGDESYDPCILELGKTYYWRVDEVNEACQPEPWKGKVWRFTVADYIIIDDMEDYTPGFGGDYSIAGFTEPYGWDCGYNNDTGSVLYLAYIDATWGKVWHGGDQAMYYFYDVNSSYYAEISNHFVLDPCDWTYADVKMLTLWFYGLADNANTGIEQMYVGLEDSDSHYAEVRYGDGEGEDINDIIIEEWQEWNIPLSWFTTANPDLDLTRMKKLYIGFGERGTVFGSGYGYVAFDDIRLYQPTCVPSQRPEEFAKIDFNNDCVIDFADIEVMAEEWLRSDVNLGEVSEPCDANLVGWWMLDEGSGGTAEDSSDYDNDGTIEVIDVNVWWVVGHNDVNHALDFDDGRVLVLDAAELRPMHQVSVSAWINYSEKQDSGRIVVKGADNKETYGLEVGSEDELVFNVRDGNDPNAEDYPKYDAKSDNDALDRDEWIHAAGTYDGSSVKCYINGELAATGDASDLVVLSQDPNDLAIGNRPDAMDKPFKGLIDDVRVYDYALSVEDVRYLGTDGTGFLALQSIADLVKGEPLGQGAVNLRDFAILVDSWLQEEMWP